MNKYEGYQVGKTDTQEYFMDEFSAWAIENCFIGNGDMLINVIEDGTTFDNWFRDYHTDLWEAEEKYWNERPSRPSDTQGLSLQGKEVA